MPPTIPVRSAGLWCNIAVIASFSVGTVSCGLTARAADPQNNTPDARQGAGRDDGLLSVPVHSYLAVGAQVDGKQRITRLHLDLDLRPQPQHALQFPAEHLTGLSVTLNSAAETDRWLATVDPQWPAVEVLQVELKAGPPDDAPRIVTSLQHLLDRLPLLRRLQVMNSGRDADWLPIVLPNTLESLELEGFARHDGLLETLGNSSVKSLGILCNSDNAANAHPSVTVALSKWPGAQNLTSLSLANCLRSSAELSAIPQLEALEELNLHRAEIAALSAFPHLKRLRLSECALSPQALRDFAASQALEQALLLGCSLTAEFDVDSLPRLSERLESLTIGRADTAMPIWKLFDRASDPTRLTAVGLRHLDIPSLRRAHNVSVCTACNEQFLQFLSSMDRLDSLMLVTDADLVRVERIMSLPGLEELKLNFPGREPPQLDEEVVREFAPGPRLRSLSIDCSGDLGGLSALAGRIPTLSALRLRLWGTPGIQLGDVNHLVGLNALKSLDLAYCVVGKDAIQAIGKFEGLERLDLTQTDLRDDALRPIAALPGLQELSLAFNTEVTSEGLASLQFGKDLKVLNLADLSLPVDAWRQMEARHVVMGDAEWPTSRGAWLFGRDIWSRRVIDSSSPGLEVGTLGSDVVDP